MPATCSMLAPAALGCSVAGGGASPPAAGFPSPDLAAPDLAALKRRLAALSAVPRHGDAVPLGPAPLDAALPGGGLGLGGLHRLAGDSAEGDAAAVAGFALALVARVRRWKATRDDAKPCFWIGPAAPSALGLPWLGHDPASLLAVRAGGDADRLWCLEEIARSGQALAAVGVLRSLDRVAGRRLQLAAERGRTPLLVIESQPSADAVPALTRWRIAAAPGGGATPCWTVGLLQARGGRPADCLVEWDHATAAFSLAADLRARPAAHDAA